MIHEASHAYMIISGNLDNGATSSEDNILIETLQQFWETEVIGIPHDATDKKRPIWPK